MTDSGTVVLTNVKWSRNNRVRAPREQFAARGAFVGRLLHCIDQAGQDSNCAVIVLKSGGNRAFCAGASFDELIAIENKEQGLEFFSGFSKVILAIRRCPKFVVCSVQGKAVGGGVGIAAAADYAVATKHAAVKLSELAIGIGPVCRGTCR